MGTSTDAILFYGYCWTDEQRYPWEENESDRDRIARILDIPAPSKPYPHERDYSEEAYDIRREYSAYWDKKRYALEATGVTIGTHCSSDCQMPYIAIKYNIMIASRGSPVVVPPNLTTGCEWDNMLNNFCKTMQITPPQAKPQWWMVSNWS